MSDLIPGKSRFIGGPRHGETIRDSRDNLRMYFHDDGDYHFDFETRDYIWRPDESLKGCDEQREAP